MDMRVLFCFYPLFVAYNAGVALLSKLCKCNGIETDLCLLLSADEFTEKAEKADFLCFSSTTEADHKQAQPFMLMAQSMGKRVLAGGPYFHLGTECRYADFVCSGDGEALTYYLLNGDETVFGHPSFAVDLDLLPLPDYEIFKDIPFDRGMPIYRDEFILPYYSSRGCPYHCRFCQAHIAPRRTRVRHRVEEDLRHLIERYGPDMFFVGDALIPYYDNAWKSSWGDLRFPFLAYIRADIQPDDLEWLIDRGMKGCAFGVESGIDDYRNRVLCKGILDEEIFRTTAILKKHHIPYLPSYIQGAPGETFAMMTETVKFADKVGGHPIFYEFTCLERGPLWV